MTHGVCNCLKSFFEGLELGGRTSKNYNWGCRWLSSFGIIIHGCRVSTAAKATKAWKEKSKKIKKKKKKMKNLPMLSFV
jgi:hypothetical protein